MPVTVQNHKLCFPLRYLNTSLDGTNVWAFIATAVKVPGDKRKTQ